MSSLVNDSTPGAASSSDRRSDVMDTALLTFARFGYRKTAMEDIAKAARISRPGLYFLFASKEELFRAAASRALEQDVAEAERILAGADRSLSAQLLDAFDQWAGRYTGSMAADIATVIEDNPDLLGEVVRTAPMRFAELITRAVANSPKKANRENADAIARTLISASIGIKYQASDREEYRERLAAAIELLLR
jgi:AcrR family transcriptional regulator